MLRPGALPCPDRSAGRRHDDGRVGRRRTVTTPHQLSQPHCCSRRLQHRAVGQDRAVGPARAGRPGQAQGRQCHQHPLTGAGHTAPVTSPTCSCFQQRVGCLGSLLLSTVVTGCRCGGSCGRRSAGARSRRCVRSPPHRPRLERPSMGRRMSSPPSAVRSISIISSRAESARVIALSPSVGCLGGFHSQPHAVALQRP